MSVCYCNDCECECEPTDEYSRWGLSHKWCSNYGCMVAMDKEEICPECLSVAHPVVHRYEMQIIRLQGFHH